MSSFGFSSNVAKNIYFNDYCQKIQHKKREKLGKEIATDLFLIGNFINKKLYQFWQQTSGSFPEFNTS